MKEHIEIKVTDEIDIQSAQLFLLDMKKNNEIIQLDEFDGKSNCIVWVYLSFFYGLDTRWPGGYIKNRINNEKYYRESDFFADSSMAYNYYSNEVIVLGKKDQDSPERAGHIMTIFNPPRAEILKAAKMLIDNDVDILWSYDVSIINVKTEINFPTQRLRTKKEAENLYRELCLNSQRYPPKTTIKLECIFVNSPENWRFTVPSG